MNIITNTNEAMELINQFSQFDYVSMMSIICTLIDIVSAKSKESSMDIVLSIEESVLLMNETLGAFQPDKEGEL